MDRVCINYGRGEICIYRNSIGKLEGKGVLGRSAHKWDDNIIVALKTHRI
jgi:hypothetical protein